MDADPTSPREAADFDHDQNVGKLILSGGAWRVLALGFASLVGIVMTAIVSREIGPAQFALFTTAMSLVTIAMTLTDVGLLTLGLREFTARTGEARERTQRTLIAVRLVLGVVSSIAIVAFAALKGYPHNLVIGLAVATVGICGLTLNISYLVPLQATFKLDVVAALEAGRQTLQAVLMTIAALAFADVGWMMATLLPTGVIMAVLAAIPARRLASIVPLFDLSEMRGLLRKVGTFAFVAGIGGTYAFIAQVLANSVLTAHQSGMFGLAFRVFVVMLSICLTAAGGAFPLLVAASEAGDTERLAYASRRLMQSAVIASVGSAVGIIAGAGFIVKVLGGAEFSDAVPVVAAIGLALPGSFMLVVSSLVLLADGHFRAMMWAASIGAFVSIVATGLLADAFGPVGAAIGVAIGEFTIAAGYVFKVRRVDPVALPGLGWVAGVLAIGAVSAAAALLPLPSLICAIVGMIVFVGLAAALKLLPPELVHPVASRLRRA
ncbi:MAG: polysaccharide biosynthesis C-terminal domain-containing protein [Solirubrobacterales bacterium]